MSKKRFSLVLICAALAAGLAFVSCSKDEDNDVKSENAVVASASPAAQLQNAINQAGGSLAEFDFAELQPLYASLQSGKASKSEDAGLRERLSALLESLFPVYNEDNPFERSRVITNLDESLRLAYDLSGYLFNNANSRGLTGSDTVSVVYVLNDTTVYTVAAQIAATTSFGSWAFSGQSVSRLDILKNGELVTSIYAALAGEAGLSLGSVSTAMDIEGLVTYREHVVSLRLQNSSSELMRSNISYTRDGSQMLVMNFVMVNNGEGVINAYYGTEYELTIAGLVTVYGSVSEIGTLFNSLPELLTLATEGGSEAECAALVEQLNGIIEARMALFSNPIGTIMLGTVADEETETYKVTLLVQSSMFGDEPMSISAILSMLGINPQDLLNLILGRNNA